VSFRAGERKDRIAFVQKKEREVRRRYFPAIFQVLKEKKRKHRTYCLYREEKGKEVIHATGEIRGARKGLIPFIALEGRRRGRGKGSGVKAAHLYHLYRKGFLSQKRRKE